MECAQIKQFIVSNLLWNSSNRIIHQPPFKQRLMMNKGCLPVKILPFLDALASLDFKLSLSEWVRMTRENDDIEPGGRGRGRPPGHWHQASLWERPATIPSFLSSTFLRHQLFSGRRRPCPSDVRAIPVTRVSDMSGGRGDLITPSPLPPFF